MRKRTLAREFALQILYQQEMNGESAEDTILAFWKNHPLAARSETDKPVLTDEIRQFTERIVLGTLEHLEEIDRIIERAAKNWQLGRMAILDRAVLRFSVYELLFLPDIPPKVTINEAVNLAKKFSQEDSGKFVNGILDKINHTEAVRHDTTPPKPSAP